MGKIKLIVYLCFMILLVTSCAQRSLLLDKSTFSPYKEFSKKSMFTPGIEIKSLSVIDGREEKQLLGMAKTGARYTETPFVANVSPQKFLDKYFNNEFQSRGIFITDVAESQVEIVINELWVDELQEKFKGERARCQIDLTVYANHGSDSFKKSYWSKIKSAANLDDGSDHLSPTLASCLNMAVEKIVKDGKLSGFLK